MHNARRKCVCVCVGGVGVGGGGGVEEDSVMVVAGGRGDRGSGGGGETGVDMFLIFDALRPVNRESHVLGKTNVMQLHVIP